MPYDVLAVFLPLLGAVLAAVCGKRARDLYSGVVTSACMICAACCSVYLFQDVAIKGHTFSTFVAPWISVGSFQAEWGLRLDTLSVVMLMVVTIVSAAVHVYSIGYMHGDKSVPRFMGYLSLFTFFMLMLVTAGNLIQLFFGWEGVGLSSYLLINFWFEKQSANKASLKAFLVNRIGDFGFLLGIFGVYALFGSIQFDAIFKQASFFADLSFTFGGLSLPALTTLCLLLFVGAMGKSAQLGLHTWLPDAMEGPTPVSALIHAATMVTAGVFMVARLSPLFEYAPHALAVVAVVGAVTAFIAALIGLTQFDIKRVIAYSTMSQLGYMFFALGVSAYSAAMFHLVTHAFFKAILFLGAGSVIHALAGEQDMRKMGGIWTKVPFTYAVMWAGSLALAGIGLDGIFGFAGFYSKDLILESALASGTSYGQFAYFFGLLSAFMTAFYSWRLIILVFHGAPRSEAHPHESSWIMLAPLVPLLVGSIWAGWYAEEWFTTGRDAFWHKALFVLPAHDSIEAALREHSLLAYLPLLFAVSGIALAYVFYMFAPGLPHKFATKLGLCYRTVLNKFYFDEIYGFVFVRGAKALGNFLWQWGDKKTIDRFGPDGLSMLIIKTAKRVSLIQSGYMTNYIVVMLLGVLAMMTWFFLRSF